MIKRSALRDAVASAEPDVAGIENSIVFPPKKKGGRIIIVMLLFKILITNIRHLHFAVFYYNFISKISMLPQQPVFSPNSYYRNNYLYSAKLKKSTKKTYNFIIKAA